jgi:hypothetical protein
MRADLERRAQRYSRIAGWTFLAFWLCIYTTFHEWPTAATGTIQTTAFWLAILAGGICLYTWNCARIERSLLDIPLEF